MIKWSVVLFASLLSFVIQEDKPWIWTRNYGGLSIATPRDMTTDGDENIYMVGDFGTEHDALVIGKDSLPSKGGYKDLFVAKFNAEGDPLWTRQIGDKNYQYGERIALDKSKNVYVLGSYVGELKIGNTLLKGNGESDNLFLAKYDAAGNYQWVKKIGTVTKVLFGISIAAMTITPQGEIIIGSLFSDCSPIGLQPYDPYSIIKLNSAGKLIWARKIKEMDSRGFVSELKLDGTGSIIVSGGYYVYGHGGDNTNSSCAVHGYLGKMSTDGKFLWTKHVVGAGCDQLLDIDVDGQNNIYVSGNTQLEKSIDAMFYKYSTNGEVLWKKTMSAGSSNGFRVAFTNDALYILCQSSGDMIIGDVRLKDNTANGSPTFHQVVIIKMDSNGTVAWAKADEIALNWQFEMTASNNGNAYMCGAFSKEITNRPERWPNGLMIVKMK